MTMKKRHMIIGSVALLSATLLTPALAQKKYDPGASDTEIKIGQTMPYSGPAFRLRHDWQGAGRLLQATQRAGRN
jgi:hypothetical protein